MVRNGVPQFCDVFKKLELWRWIENTSKSFFFFNQGYKFYLTSNLESPRTILRIVFKILHFKMKEKKDVSLDFHEFSQKVPKTRPGMYAQPHLGQSSSIAAVSWSMNSCIPYFDRVTDRCTSHMASWLGKQSSGNFCEFFCSLRLCLVYYKSLEVTSSILNH